MKSSKNILLSVICRSYNGEKYIFSALKSLSENLNENLNRLNSINFPFTLSADELSKPSINSLIISAYTIKTLNEELKNSRKIFVNFYKLPQENKKIKHIIIITVFFIIYNFFYI